MPSVVFSTNCYKRDYDYLVMGGFDTKVLLNDYPFHSTAIILNEVEDAFEADIVVTRQQMEKLVLDYFGLKRDVFVDPKTGYDGYIYSIDSLIELFLFQGYDYIVHYCGDVELERKNDWITEGIAKIESGDYILARPRLPVFAGSSEEELALTEYTIFSDHVYLMPTAFFTRAVMAKIFELTEPSCVPPHPAYGGESFERKMSRYMHWSHQKMAVIRSAVELPCRL